MPVRTFPPRASTAIFRFCVTPILLLVEIDGAGWRIFFRREFHAINNTRQIIFVLARVLRAHAPERFHLYGLSFQSGRANSVSAFRVAFWTSLSAIITPEAQIPAISRESKHIRSQREISQTRRVNRGLLRLYSTYGFRKL